MIGLPRIKVLWLGSKNYSELEDRLSTLGSLQLIPVASERELIAGLPVARAIVFEFDGDMPLYIGRVRRTSPVASRYGALIVLINGRNVDSGAFQRASKKVFEITGQPYGPEYAPLRPIRSFQRDLCRAAHEIAVWLAGPCANPSMKIIGRFDPNHELLLRRSFSDFPSIEVIPLTEGKSGAAVYSVSTRGQPRTKFLAKVDATNRIAGEADRYLKYACKTVNFNNRPNLDMDRTMYTSDLSILIEDFLDKAKPLYEVLPYSIPAVLISAVFEGSLRNWRHKSRLETCKLSDVSQIRKILDRRSSSFFAAADYAKRTLKSTFDGEELLEACNAIGPLTCTWSRIHGDLHGGNLYVGTGSSEVVLFDFMKTEIGPAVLDPACLEVDLSFNRANPISSNLVRKLYQAPLWLPPIWTPASSRHAWLLDTVRAIRRFGLTESDHQAYTFVTACFLIRYASFDDNGTTKSRALATCLASSLIRHLMG